MPDNAPSCNMRFNIEWDSAVAHHCDCLFTDKDELSGENFPKALKQRIHSLFHSLFHSLEPGESIQVDLDPGQPVEPYTSDQVKIFPVSQFNTGFAQQQMTPQLGRFYPKAILSLGLSNAKSDYFIQSGRFDDLNTWSLRGLPRPQQDNYKRPHSDPLFALWGRVKPDNRVIG